MKYVITVTEARYGPDLSKTASKATFTTEAEAFAAFLDAIRDASDARIHLNEVNGEWTRNLANAERS